MEPTRSERSAAERKKRLEKYFAKTPDPNDRTVALALLGLAGVAVLIGLIGFGSGSGFVGLLGLVGGGVSGYKGFLRKSAYERAYAEAEPKPSDGEMDNLLGTDLRTIEERAMSDLGLTADDLEFVAQEWDPIANLMGRSPRVHVPRVRPMVVFGPMMPSRAAVGKDDVWRFSTYEVMVICPTGYHLAIFRTCLDFLTGGLRTVETQEYHYSDVVAVSTTSNPGRELTAGRVDDPDNDQVRFAKTVLREFQIVVASGDRSKVVVGIADDSDPDRRARLQDSGVDQVIGSVRRMLREKKGGVVPPPTQAHASY